VFDHFDSAYSEREAATGQRLVDRPCALMTALQRMMPGIAGYRSEAAQRNDEAARRT
jgi:hypothetical protein